MIIKIFEILGNTIFPDFQTCQTLKKIIPTINPTQKIKPSDPKIKNTNSLPQINHVRALVAP